MAQVVFWVSFLVWKTGGVSYAACQRPSGNTLGYSPGGKKFTEPGAAAPVLNTGAAAPGSVCSVFIFYRQGFKFGDIVDSQAWSAIVPKTWDSRMYRRTASRKNQSLATIVYCVLVLIRRK